MNQLQQDLYLLYEQLIGSSSIQIARGFIPVSFHGSQVAEEFFPAWEALENRLKTISSDQVSFLEIGAYKGLWPLMFSLVCKKLGKIPCYTTVTLLDQDPENSSLASVENYYSQNKWVFNLINSNSNNPNSVSKVKDISTNYNLVFIDADHTYDCAKIDMENYSPLCSNTLIFHDTKPRIATPEVGVWQAIADMKLNPDEEFSTNDLNYGIGLKFI